MSSIAVRVALASETAAVTPPNRFRVNSDSAQSIVEEGSSVRFSDRVANSAPRPCLVAWLDLAELQDEVHEDRVGLGLADRLHDIDEGDVGLGRLGLPTGLPYRLTGFAYRVSDRQDEIHEDRVGRGLADRLHNVMVGSAGPRAASVTPPRQLGVLENSYR